MFTVEGYAERTYYTVIVGAPTDDNPGQPPAVGIVTGSPTVLAMLDLHTSERVAVTPTGPEIVLDPTDEASVYGALLGLTEVVRTTGDVPDVLGPLIDGAVY